ncbi:hypothetical protein [Streptomyces sp. NPDC093269]|uniref:hypothetical protein n=1 Tax=Streptomyces sp. NPDC093269 TaxID=3366038 RepID=UPI0037F2AD87
MAVRTVTAAAVLTTAAVVVYALACRDRRLRRKLTRLQAANRLTSGRLCQDIEVLRRRLHQEMAQQAVIAAAGLVVTEALSAHTTRIHPPTEGGPQ